MLSLLPESDRAGSPITGIVLMIGITLVLAMLVLLVCLGFQLPPSDTPVPAIFVIKQIRHINPQGVLDNDSYVVIQNTGKIPYDNRNLYAKAYRNGVHMPCDISTMNGNDFLPTHHFGIQTLGGLGSHDFFWYPGATIHINYAKGTFHPGDTVEFEVYYRTNHTLISRYRYPESEKYTAKWFYNYVLNPQAA